MRVDERMRPCKGRPSDGAVSRPPGAYFLTIVLSALQRN